MRFYYRNKKFFEAIWTIVMIVVGCIMFSLLSGCVPSTLDENGNSTDGLDRFVFIEDPNVWAEEEDILAYDKDTKVVYYYDYDGHNIGIHSPYYIYENGAIYGAIYEDGEIEPVPFAASTAIPTN